MPLHTGQLALLAIAVAGITLVRSSGLYSSWFPPLWSSVTEVTREVMALVGPIVMLAATWTARVRHTIACGPVPARGWAGVVSRHLGQLVITSILAFVAGLAPVIVWACLDATTGSYDVLTLLASSAGVVGWICTGYLIGALLRPAAALASAFIIAVIVVYGTPLISEAINSAGVPISLYSLAPAWFDLSPSHIWAPTPATSLLRIVLFCVIALTATLVTLHLDTPVTGARRATRFAPLALPLAVAIAAVAAQPELFVRIENPQAACATSQHSTVCLDAALEELVPLTQEQVDAMTARFGPGAFSGFASSGEDHLSTMRPTDGTSAFIPGVMLRPRQEYLADVTYAVASAISGFTACVERSGGLALDEISDDVYEARYVTDLLSLELQERAGHPSPDIRLPLSRDRDGDSATNPDEALFEANLAFLESMDDEELRDWLNAHAQDLSSCSIDPEELTG